VMGGSTGLGNITPLAEFNVWADPEAAAVVFASGAPIRMAGYNVTSRTGTNEAEIGRLLAGGNRGVLLRFERLDLRLDQLQSGDLAFDPRPQRRRQRRP